MAGQSGAAHPWPGCLAGEAGRRGKQLEGPLLGSQQPPQLTLRARQFPEKALLSSTLPRPNHEHQKKLSAVRSGRPDICEPREERRFFSGRSELLLHDIRTSARGVLVGGRHRGPAESCGWPDPREQTTLETAPRGVGMSLRGRSGQARRAVLHLT